MDKIAKEDRKLWDWPIDNKSCPFPVNYILLAGDSAMCTCVKSQRPNKINDRTGEFVFTNIDHPILEMRRIKTVRRVIDCLLHGDVALRNMPQNHFGTLQYIGTPMKELSGLGYALDNGIDTDPFFKYNEAYKLLLAGKHAEIDKIPKGKECEVTFAAPLDDNRYIWSSEIDDQIYKKKVAHTKNTYRPRINMNKKPLKLVNWMKIAEILDNELFTITENTSVVCLAEAPGAWYAYLEQFTKKIAGYSKDNKNIPVPKYMK